MSMRGWCALIAALAAVYSAGVHCWLGISAGAYLLEREVGDGEPAEKPGADFAEERADHHVELALHRQTFAVAQQPVDDESHDRDLQEEKRDVADQEAPHLVVKRGRREEPPTERVQHRAGGEQ